MIARKGSNVLGVKKKKRDMKLIYTVSSYEHCLGKDGRPTNELNKDQGNDRICFRSRS